MDSQDIVAKFQFIEYGEENIDAIYRTNLALFKFDNSDKQNYEREDLQIENGILKTPQPIASNQFDKFNISEEDFRKAELAALNSIDETNLDYGQKTKYQIYKEYIQFKIQYPDWYQVKNRNGFYTIKRSKIDKYRKAIYSGYFKEVYTRNDEDGVENFFYYGRRVRDWQTQRDQLLRENINLQPRLKILLYYNALLSGLMGEVVRLFEIVHKYDGSEIAYINSFNMDNWELTKSLENIGQFSQNINHNINTGHYKIALEMQHYCLLIFDDIVSIIETSFFIKVYKTPLKKNFQDVVDKLKNAIDIDKLDLLLRLGGVSRVAHTADSQFEFEDVDRTFRSIEGKKIFEKFHSNYRDQENKSKNYSFLHYALKEFDYTTISRAKFIALCKKIGIDFTYSTRYNWEHFGENEDLKTDFLRYNDEVQQISNERS